MTSFVIPPDTRSVGSGNPPQDVNQLADVAGLLAAVLAQLAGYPGNSSVPAGNAANITAVQTLLGNFPGTGLAPSGDTTGATDPANVQNMMNLCGTAILQPGSWYGDTTVTGNEGQFIHCMPGVTWKLTATGIPAFQWTMANTSSYSQTGTGGITGRPLIVGPGTTGNPSDGSIAVQVGDILQLEVDVFAKNCQYGLLAENQYFWTEQGHFRIHTTGCTNPVVCQIAASGGSNRTGSYDRSDFDIYTADQLSTTTSAVLALLNGANPAGGSVRIQGNLSGASGANGGYALRLSGQAPGSSAVTTYALLTNTQLYMALEVDNSGGTVPATVLVDTDCAVQRCSGNLLFSGGFNPATLTGTWQFLGPVNGDTVLEGANTFTSVAAAPSGWSGSILLTYIYIGGLMYIEAGLIVPSGYTLAPGTNLVTGVGAPYQPTSGREINLQAFVSGTGNEPIACVLTGGGDLEYVGTSSISFSAGGSIGGSTVYSPSH